MTTQQEPDLDICDAHHHLWDLSTVRYPWLNAPLGTMRFFGDPSPIQKDYLVADLQSDIGSLPVIQSVHIQVGAADDQHLAETAWVQNQIDTHSGTDKELPGAMVAYTDLESATLNKTLDKLQSFSGVRGIRQIIGRAPEEDQQTGSGLLLSNSAWQEGLHQLSERSLSFDLQLIPSQMEQAYKIFKQVEDLKVVLCHCGSPWFLNKKYQHSQSYELWLNGLRKLASLPNMHCKISGLSMFNQEWDMHSIRDITKAVLNTFGPERCMLGSNFPVDKLYVSYQKIWQSYFQLTEHLPAQQRKELFGDNCRRFYRISSTT